jgi:coatomer subunit beta'
VDGERVPLSEKELGAVELFPQSVLHNANGRFIAVCGDNEYVIYTAQALRNKSFGNALDFVWSSGGVGDYAVRESTSRVKIFRNFKETAAFKPPIAAEGLSGGAMVGVRSSDTVCFYEWDSGKMVRRIEVAAKAVTWNDGGDLVAITSEDAFYVLRFSREEVAKAEAAKTPLGEEGIEAAFELQHEVADKVQGGVWVGACFVYTNAANRLNYYVGGEVITLAHLDRRMYILGYLAREGRVFLVDKAGSVVSYGLCLAVLEYQTVVVRRDFGAANRILPEVPREHLNSIAKFLESQGFKEQALVVADDPDIKFDLALQLGKLDMALVLLREAGVEIGRAHV